MWLRRLVGVMMVAAFIVMNTMTVWGLAAPKKEVKPAVTVTVAAPTIELSAEPTTIPAGTSTALKWTTTGDPKCSATSSVPGPWVGEKTQVGAESSGRLSKEGTYTYTLKCINEGGEATTTATITVSKAAVASTQKQAISSSSTSSASSAFCKSRKPCYGPKDVAAHGSANNCWGWNGDKVFNISTFDKAYHVAKSGVSSIEISAVCGKDLGPALNGQVKGGKGEAPRNHLTATKTNASANTSSYFVGYYDSAK